MKFICYTMLHQTDTNISSHLHLDGARKIMKAFPSFYFSPLSYLPLSAFAPSPLSPLASRIFDCSALCKYMDCWLPFIIISSVSTSLWLVSVLTTLLFSLRPSFSLSVSSIHQSVCFCDSLSSLSPSPCFVSQTNFFHFYTSPLLSDTFLNETFDSLLFLFT